MTIATYWLVRGCVIGLVLCSIGVNDSVADETAARVGNQMISVTDVNRELARKIGTRDFDTAAMRVLRAATLEHLVRRALILEYLSRQGTAASDADIDLGIARMKKKLAQEDKTLADYLDKAKLTAADLRAHFRWNVSWDRYLESTLTEANLRKHFDDHRRSFDGTTMDVAHLLLKLAPEPTAEQIAAATAQANRIRGLISNGELSFAAAAKQFSQSPTASKGGDIGKISRNEPMPESFNKAAFALQKGETSQPVITNFGVHLIHCLSVEPGQRSYQNAQIDVAASAREFLFRWASDRQKKQTRVEYTGTIAPFAWGTETFKPVDE